MQVTSQICYPPDCRSVDLRHPIFMQEENVSGLKLRWLDPLPNKTEHRQAQVKEYSDESPEDFAFAQRLQDLMSLSHLDRLHQARG
jgi:hypothetical protein